MNKYNLLEEEINWCKSHRNPEEKKYQDGFISGLEHALWLMKSRSTQLVSDGIKTITKKVYVLSERKDAELEKAIYEMDAYHLRIALYGIARGWRFDEAILIAEETQEEIAKRKTDIEVKKSSNA